MGKTTVQILRCLVVVIMVLFVMLIVSNCMLEDRNAKIEEMVERIQILEQEREQILQQEPKQELEQKPEQEPEQLPKPTPELKRISKDADEQTDMEYAGEFKCTAYCTEKYEHICGTGYGITASGEPVQAGITVAVGDTDRFPYGTVLYIEGIGTRIVQDTGGGLADNQLDLAMDTHEEALNWGCQDSVKVYVVKG